MKTFLVFLAIYMVLLSCERDLIPELDNTLPKVSSIKVYNNSILKQEYIYSGDHKTLKEINYKDDLSISDSIIYNYDLNSRVNLAVSYSIFLNSIDTIKYNYLGSHLKEVIGADSYDISYDQFNRPSNIDIIGKEFHTTEIYNYNTNNNISLSTSVIDKINNPFFPKTRTNLNYSYTYDDKVNPLRQIGNLKINPIFISENNVLTLKCTSIQYIWTEYEHPPSEEIKTETITNYNYKYNNSGLPFEVKKYVVSNKDTVTYHIYYLK